MCIVPDKDQSDEFMRKKSYETYLPVSVDRKGGKTEPNGLVPKLRSGNGYARKTPVLRVRQTESATRARSQTEVWERERGYFRYTECVQNEN
ncbi:MAG: hypothetical protein B6245_19645 [Desulfobacteraceae bacterium 4572_88]|nr:MAG: hypothetical protein B6245_19645 [Desulfobacteraceae bacterium 4572_88]RLC13873.1 MAG: hypothetical protein DRI57_15490 [Deltaproteobacteria bacterium]